MVNWILHGFGPSYKLSKIKIKINPRSTYPKTLNPKVRLRNEKVLGTHSVQIESGLLDSHDQCTPLCMLWMTCCTCETKIKSHKFIYEFILFWIFFLKKFRSVDVSEKKKNLVYKKLDLFLLCKKSGFWRENSDLFLFNKTKSFGLKKIRSIVVSNRIWFQFIKKIRSAFVV